MTLGVAALEAESAARRERLPWPGHLLLGWVLAGLANVGLGVWHGGRPGGAWIDLSASLVDLGRHTALGLGSMLLVWLFRAWAPGPPALRWLSFAAFSLGLGTLVLPTDLDGLAERSAEVLGVAPGLASAAIVVLVAGAVPALAWATRHRSFRRRRWNMLRAGMSALGALAAFGLNVSISPGGNPSAHLYLSWLAAVLAGHALPPLELQLAQLRLPGGVQVVVGGALGAASLWALFGSHSNSVMIQLARRPSSLHLLAVFHTDGGLDRIEATLAARAGPFFSERNGLPSVAPSAARPHVERPIVIFFSVDSLRADVLSHPEHSKHVPEMLQLSRSGAIFTQARAPGSMTKYTLGSISSGKYFSQQYWTQRGQNRWPVQDRSIHFASLLSEAGVFTAAFPATHWLEDGYGVLRGFTQNQMRGKSMLGRKGWIDGASLTADLISTLEQHAEGPAFLWVHYLDSHDPFHKGGRGGKKFRRYLRTLRIVDGYLRAIRRALERLGLTERTLLLVASDHGEAFGEHDSFNHGGNLYDELLRVPLLAAGPGVIARPITAAVSLIDVGPTVLDWFGLAIPASFMGESLVPLLLGGTKEFSRPIAAETRLKQAMLFADGYKVIRDLRRQTLELYDLNADPGELQNLSDAVDPDHEEHILLLRSFFRIHTYREHGYRVPYVK